MMKLNTISEIRKIDLFIFKMTMNSAQCLFRELPYYGIEFIEHHGQFNNSLNNNLTTKKTAPMPEEST